MGISRYSLEGYADPAAYEAIRNINTFSLPGISGI